MHVEHADGDPLGTDPIYHEAWFITADSTGNFTTSWYVPSIVEGDAYGATLLLTAHGDLGSEASWIFTDSGNFDYSTTSGKSNSVSIISGATDSSTLSVDVKAPKNNGTFNASLNFTTQSGTTIGIGVGAGLINLTSITNSYITGSNNNASDITHIFPITVTVGASVPNGVYKFQAVATSSTGNPTNNKEWLFEVVVGNTIGPVGTVTVGSQSGVSVYGTASTPSFSITSLRGNTGNVNGTYSVSGLPSVVASNFSPSATFIANGSEIFTGVTLNLNVPASLNAGSYNFTVSLSDGSSTSTAIGTLVVNKAVLIATANNQTKVYGSSNPVLTFQYSGWVNEVEAIDTAPTASSSVNGATNVGSYSESITLSGGSDNNYSFSFVAGDFEVTKAVLTVTADNQTKVYGSANPALTFQYSGWVNPVEAIDTAPTASSSVNGTTNVGSYPGSITLSGGSDNNYSFSFVAGNFEVTKKTITVTPDSNQTKVYGAANPVYTYGYTPSLISGDSFSGALSRDAGEDAGLYNLTQGDLDLSANYTLVFTSSVEFTITKAVLTVTADNKTRQYSDANPVLTVTIAGFMNDDNNEDLTTKPAASTLANASSPVGTYPIIASGGLDDNYSFVYFSGTLTVIQEDACAYYTGALFASTANATSSNATITLAATIKESSDSSAGNITNAKVYFMIEGGQKLGPFTSGIVTVGDNTVGTVVCNWLVDIGNNDYMNYTVRVIVEGDYNSGTCGDAETVVNVSKPLDDFITGGGYLKLTSSSGIKAGDIGTKNNFGFNVKFNKSKTNLQGNINTIIRRTESDGLLHIYQIKGNSMTSLSVQPASNSNPPTATFNGKANIQDITNPLAPISVEGNATLQVTMIDNGEPGAKSGSMDRISITVWNKSGGLWFASNWNGVKTIDQNIAQGNLKVRSSGSFVSGTALTNTALVSSLAPSTVGQSVTFTATVAGSGTSIPSGTITFIDYSTNTTLAKVSLNKGIATYSTSSLILGEHEIYAYYGGDSKYSSSANSLIQTVNTPLAGRTILATSTKKDVLGLTEPTSFDVKIFPNPAQYQFTLELEGGSSEKTEVVVYDLLGRMVKHIENNDVQPINFGEELPAGTYIVTVRQGENQKTIKLIKQ